MGGWLASNAQLVERLGVLGDRGRRRALDVREDGIEDERRLLREVLDVLREIPVVDREEAQWFFSKGTQSEKCSVPSESDASYASSRMDLAASFRAKPCSRDLMDM